MKRNVRILLAVTALLAAAFLSVFAPQAVLGASYNDEIFNDYENMRDKGNVVKYVVPNLYQNDAAFSNVRNYPLVVQGGVAYVPLEMFFNLSSISVKTGFVNGGFYIVNSKTQSFVSFDVANDMVTTDDKKSLSLVTKIFYQTRYLPAVQICDMVGLDCEIYDSPEDGVYALRISDGKQKLSFTELIKRYSPTKLPEKDPSPDDGSDSDPDDDLPGPDRPPVIPDVPEIGARTIYLTFENLPNEFTGDILDLLKKHQRKATFFCEGDKMLEYPELVRRILVEGHAIGIHSMTHDSGFLEESPDNFIADWNEANDVLEMVAKQRTRLYRAPEGLKNTLRTDPAWEDAARRAGMLVYDWNINSYDYFEGENTPSKIYRRITTKLFALEEHLETDTALIRFHSLPETIAVLDQVLTYIDSYPQLVTAVIDETTEQINFFGKERLD